MGPTFQLSGVDVPIFSPTAVPLIGTAGAALLYLRACSILESRGRHIGLGQRIAYFLGLALILIGTQSFIDPVGEDALLSLHMVQHMMIADLSAPLLLYGIRAPLLYFFWPKPVLVAVARMRPVRALWAWLRRPLVAISVWLITLYAWHVPWLYDAALRHRLVHDLEHITFVLGGVLAWWPLMDPTHVRLEGRVWKAAYVFAARTLGGFVGAVMVAWPSQLYPAYRDKATEYGLTALEDQELAGTIMMSVDALIVIVGVTIFLLSMDWGSRDGDDDDLPEAARLAALAAHPDHRPSTTAVETPPADRAPH